MIQQTDMLARLTAKDDIRDLVMLYARGIDRGDLKLMRSLYTADATEEHAHWFSGRASDFLEWLKERNEMSLPGSYAGHHVCNHLITLDGDEASGEVYCISFGKIQDDRGGAVEDLLVVRYLDRYRKEDGHWKFAARKVVLELANQHPINLSDAEFTRGSK